MLSKQINQLHRDLGRCHRRLSTAVPTELSTNTRLYAVLVGLTALSALLAPICLAQSSTNGNPHHFLMPCDSCHESSASNDPADSKPVGPLHADINRSCAQSGCHNYQSPLNHPVAMQSNGNVPARMPLNEKGEITCLTCHDELSNSNGSVAWLRHEPGREFCASCHRGTGRDARKRSHWQFTTKAHLLVNKPKSSFENDNDFFGDIDLESYTCLGCHDEISALVPMENKTSSKKAERWKTMPDHPIGMTYETVASNNSFSFNNTVTLDSTIRFFDGRVGCGSCHNLYNSEKNNLAVPIKRGALCRQCHIR